MMSYGRPSLTDICSILEALSQSLVSASGALSGICRALNSAICRQLTCLRIICSVNLDPLRAIRADTAVGRLNALHHRADNLSDRSQLRDAMEDKQSAKAEQPVLSLSIDPHNVTALDALKICCVIKGPLEFVIPDDAFTALSGALNIFHASGNGANFLRAGGTGIREVLS